MPDFPIVDTHLHIWDTRKLDYPWLNDIPLLNKPHLLPDYDRARGSIAVEKMVFVQAEANFAQFMDETAWVTRLAESDHRIEGIVSWAPLEKGDTARADIEKLTENKRIKGLRRIIQFESDIEFCLRSGFITGVRALADYGLSFDICISHIQLANTIRMIRQCPNVQFVLDHIGKPHIKDHVFEPWASEIKRLAEMPNVWCKVSGLVTEADHKNWIKEDLKPYIDHVIACFGFDRVMYGGDWPVASLAAQYPQWVETLEWAVSGCSDHELRQLFRNNAIRFYRLNGNSTPAS